MILRRIIAHFRKQEWTAIGIDFVIVVLGVFVATQVSDWNASRLARAEYYRALGRLTTEVDANLVALDSNLPEINRALRVAGTGLDALQSCQDSPANRTAINAGLEEIRGTNALPLRMSALRDLTVNPSLLSQQSDAEREHFSTLLGRLELFQQEMRYAELQPLAERVENNSILRVGPPQVTTLRYVDIEYTKVRRPLLLAVSVDQACRNDALIKAFFTWERWQSNLPALAGPVRTELEATRTMLQARR